MDENLPANAGSMDSIPGIQEDATCRGTSNAANLNHQACALEPGAKTTEPTHYNH